MTCPKCGHCDEYARPRYVKSWFSNKDWLKWCCNYCLYEWETPTMDAIPKEQNNDQKTKEG